MEEERAVVHWWQWQWVLTYLRPALYWLLDSHSWFYRIYRNVKSGFDPRFRRRRRLLSWVGQAAGREVLDLTTVWQDGSILCDIIHNACPSSISGQDFEDYQAKDTFRHAQALAYRCLMIQPLLSASHEKSFELHSSVILDDVNKVVCLRVGTRNEAECLLPKLSQAFSEKDFNGTELTPNIEKRLFRYLQALRLAINKKQLNHSVDEDSEAEAHIAEEYIARGMGLIMASRQQRAIFYIYSRDGSSLMDVHVEIRGPGEDFGSLLVTQNESCDNISDGSIPIEYRLTKEYLRVSYQPRSTGLHELSISRHGYIIPGSPFLVTVDNISENLPVKRFNSIEWYSEDEEKRQQELQDKRKNAKVKCRIVDFVTEKMYLTDDGKLLKVPDSLKCSETPPPPDFPAPVPLVLEESSIAVSPSPTPSNDSIKSSKSRKTTSPRSKRKRGDKSKWTSVRPDSVKYIIMRPQKAEVKRVSNAASQVTLEFQPNLFQERCRKIVTVCDYLLRHCPRNKSLEIISGAGNILQSGYPVKISSHEPTLQQKQSNDDSTNDDDVFLPSFCPPPAIKTNVYSDYGLNDIRDVLSKDAHPYIDVTNDEKEPLTNHSASMARISYRMEGNTKSPRRRASFSSIGQSTESKDIHEDEHYCEGPVKMEEYTMDSEQQQSVGDTTDSKITLVSYKMFGELEYTQNTEENVEGNISDSVSSNNESYTDKKLPCVGPFDCKSTESDDPSISSGLHEIRSKSLFDQQEKCIHKIQGEKRKNKKAGSYKENLVRKIIAHFETSLGNESERGDILAPSPKSPELLEQISERSSLSISDNSMPISTLHSKESVDSNKLHLEYLKSIGASEESLSAIKSKIDIFERVASNQAINTSGNRIEPLVKVNIDKQEASLKSSVNRDFNLTTHVFRAEPAIIVSKHYANLREISLSQNNNEPTINFDFNRISNSSVSTIPNKICSTNTLNAHLNGKSYIINSSASVDDHRKTLDKFEKEPTRTYEHTHSQEYEMRMMICYDTINKKETVLLNGNHKENESLFTNKYQSAHDTSRIIANEKPPSKNEANSDYIKVIDNDQTINPVTCNLIMTESEYKFEPDDNINLMRTKSIKIDDYVQQTNELLKESLLNDSNIVNTGIKKELSAGNTSNLPALNSLIIKPRDSDSQAPDLNELLNDSVQNAETSVLDLTEETYVGIETTTKTSNQDDTLELAKINIPVANKKNDAKLEFITMMDSKEIIDQVTFDGRTTNENVEFGAKDKITTKQKISIDLVDIVHELNELEEETILNDTKITKSETQKDLLVSDNISNVITVRDGNTNVKDASNEEFPIQDSIVTISTTLPAMETTDFHAITNRNLQEYVTFEKLAILTEHSMETVIHKTKSNHDNDSAILTNNITTYIKGNETKTDCGKTTNTNRIFDKVTFNRNKTRAEDETDAYVKTTITHKNSIEIVDAADESNVLLKETLSNNTSIANSENLKELNNLVTMTEGDKKINDLSNNECPILASDTPFTTEPVIEATELNALNKESIHESVISKTPASLTESSLKPDILATKSEQDDITETDTIEMVDINHITNKGTFDRSATKAGDKSYTSDKFTKIKSNSGYAIHNPNELLDKSALNDTNITIIEPHKNEVILDNTTNFIAESDISFEVTSHYECLKQDSVTTSTTEPVNKAVELNTITKMNLVEPVNSEKPALLPKTRMEMNIFVTKSEHDNKLESVTSYVTKEKSKNEIITECVNITDTTKINDQGLVKLSIPEAYSKTGAEYKVTTTQRKSVDESNDLLKESVLDDSVAGSESHKDLVMSENTSHLVTINNGDTNFKDTSNEECSVIDGNNILTTESIVEATTLNALNNDSIQELVTSNTPLLLLEPDILVGKSKQEDIAVIGTIRLNTDNPEKYRNTNCIETFNINNMKDRKAYDFTETECDNDSDANDKVKTIEIKSGDNVQGSNELLQESDVVMSKNTTKLIMEQSGDPTFKVSSLEIDILSTKTKNDDLLESVTNNVTTDNIGNESIRDCVKCIESNQIFDQGIFDTIKTEAVDKTSADIEVTTTQRKSVDVFDESNELLEQSGLDERKLVKSESQKDLGLLDDTSNLSFKDTSNEECTILDSITIFTTKPIIEAKEANSINNESILDSVTSETSVLLKNSSFELNIPAPKFEKEDIVEIDITKKCMDSTENYINTDCNKTIDIDNIIDTNKFDPTETECDNYSDTNDKVTTVEIKSGDNVHGSNELHQESDVVMSENSTKLIMEQSGYPTFKVSSIEIDILSTKYEHEDLLESVTNNVTTDNIGNESITDCIKSIDMHQIFDQRIFDTVTTEAVDVPSADIEVTTTQRKSVDAFDESNELLEQSGLDDRKLVKSEIQKDLSLLDDTSNLSFKDPSNKECSIPDSIIIFTTKPVIEATEFNSINNESILDSVTSETPALLKESSLQTDIPATKSEKEDIAEIDITKKSMDGIENYINTDCIKTIDMVNTIAKNKFDPTEIECDNYLDTNVKVTTIEIKSGDNVQGSIEFLQESALNYTTITMIKPHKDVSMSENITNFIMEPASNPNVEVTTKNIDIHSTESEHDDLLTSVTNNVTTDNIANESITDCVKSMDSNQIFDQGIFDTVTTDAVDETSADLEVTTTQRKSVDAVDVSNELLEKSGLDDRKLAKSESQKEIGLLDDTSNLSFKDASNKECSILDSITIFTTQPIIEATEFNSINNESNLDSVTSETPALLKESSLEPNIPATKSKKEDVAEICIINKIMDSTENYINTDCIIDKNKFDPTETECDNDSDTNDKVTTIEIKSGDNVQGPNEFLQKSALNYTTNTMIEPHHDVNMSENTTKLIMEPTGDPIFEVMSVEINILSTKSKNDDLLESVTNNVTTDNIGHESIIDCVKSIDSKQIFDQNMFDTVTTEAVDEISADTEVTTTKRKSVDVVDVSNELLGESGLDDRKLAKSESQKDLGLLDDTSNLSFKDTSNEECSIQDTITIFTTKSIFESKGSNSNNNESNLDSVTSETPALLKESSLQPDIPATKSEKEDIEEIGITKKIMDYTENYINTGCIIDKNKFDPTEMECDSYLDKNDKLTTIEIKSGDDVHGSNEFLQESALNYTTITIIKPHKDVNMSKNITNLIMEPTGDPKFEVTSLEIDIPSTESESDDLLESVTYNVTTDNIGNESITACVKSTDSNQILDQAIFDTVTTDAVDETSADLEVTTTQRKSVDAVDVSNELLEKSGLDDRKLAKSESQKEIGLLDDTSNLSFKDTSNKECSIPDSITIFTTKPIIESTEFNSINNESNMESVTSETPALLKESSLEPNIPATKSEMEDIAEMDMTKKSMDGPENYINTDCIKTIGIDNIIDNNKCDLTEMEFDNDLDTNDKVTTIEIKSRDNIHGSNDFLQESALNYTTITIIDPIKDVNVSENTTKLIMEPTGDPNFLVTSMEIDIHSTKSESDDLLESVTNNVTTDNIGNETITDCVCMESNQIFDQRIFDRPTVTTEAVNETSTDIEVTTTQRKSIDAVDESNELPEETGLDDRKLAKSESQKDLGLLVDTSNIGFKDTSNKECSILDSINIFTTKPVIETTESNSNNNESNLESVTSETPALLKESSLEPNIPATKSKKEDIAEIYIINKSMDGAENYINTDSIIDKNEFYPTEMECDNYLDTNDKVTTIEIKSGDDVHGSNQFLQESALNYTTITIIKPYKDVNMSENITNLIMEPTGDPNFEVTSLEIDIPSTESESDDLLESVTNNVTTDNIGNESITDCVKITDSNQILDQAIFDTVTTEAVNETSADIDFLTTQRKSVDAVNEFKELLDESGLDDRKLAKNESQKDLSLLDDTSNLSFKDTSNEECSIPDSITIFTTQPIIEATESNSINNESNMESVTSETPALLKKSSLEPDIPATKSEMEDIAEMVITKKSMDGTKNDINTDCIKTIGIDNIIDNNKCDLTKIEFDNDLDTNDKLTTTEIKSGDNIHGSNDFLQESALNYTTITIIDPIKDANVSENTTKLIMEPAGDPNLLVKSMEIDVLLIKSESDDLLESVTINVTTDNIGNESITDFVCRDSKQIFDERIFDRPTVTTEAVDETRADIEVTTTQRKSVDEYNELLEESGLDDRELAKSDSQKDLSQLDDTSNLSFKDTSNKECSILDSITIFTTQPIIEATESNSINNESNLDSVTSETPALLKESSLESDIPATKSEKEDIEEIDITKKSMDCTENYINTGCIIDKNKFDPTEIECYNYIDTNVKVTTIEIKSGDNVQGSIEFLQESALNYTTITKMKPHKDFSMSENITNFIMEPASDPNVEVTTKNIDIPSTESEHDDLLTSVTNNMTTDNIGNESITDCVKSTDSNQILDQAIFDTVTTEAVNETSADIDFLTTQRKSVDAVAESNELLEESSLDDRKSAKSESQKDLGLLDDTSNLSFNDTSNNECSILDSITIFTTQPIIEATEFNSINNESNLDSVTSETPALLKESSLEPNIPATKSEMEDIAEIDIINKIMDSTENFINTDCIIDKNKFDPTETECDNDSDTNDKVTTIEIKSGDNVQGPNEFLQKSALNYTTNSMIEPHHDVNMSENTTKLIMEPTGDPIFEVMSVEIDILSTKSENDDLLESVTNNVTTDNIGHESIIDCVKSIDSKQIFDQNIFDTVTTEAVDETSADIEVTTTQRKSVDVVDVSNELLEESGLDDRILAKSESQEDLGLLDDTSNLSFKDTSNKECSIPDSIIIFTTKPIIESTESNPNNNESNLESVTSETPALLKESSLESDIPATKSGKEDIAEIDITKRSLDNTEHYINTDYIETIYINNIIDQNKFDLIKTECDDELDAYDKVATIQIYSSDNVNVSNELLQKSALNGNKITMVEAHKDVVMLENTSKLILEQAGGPNFEVTSMEIDTLSPKSEHDSILESVQNNVTTDNIENEPLTDCSKCMDTNLIIDQGTFNLSTTEADDETIAVNKVTTRQCNSADESNNLLEESVTPNSNKAKSDRKKDLVLSDNILNLVTLTNGNTNFKDVSTEECLNLDSINLYRPTSEPIIEATEINALNNESIHESVISETPALLTESSLEPNTLATKSKQDDSFGTYTAKVSTYNTENYINTYSVKTMDINHITNRSAFENSADDELDVNDKAIMPKRNNSGGAVHDPNELLEESYLNVTNKTMMEPYKDIVISDNITNLITETEGDTKHNESEPKFNRLPKCSELSLISIDYIDYKLTNDSKIYKEPFGDDVVDVNQLEPDSLKNKQMESIFLFNNTQPHGALKSPVGEQEESRKRVIPIPFAYSDILNFENIDMIDIERNICVLSDDNMFTKTHQSDSNGFDVFSNTKNSLELSDAEHTNDFIQNVGESSDIIRESSHSSISQDVFDSRHEVCSFENVKEHHTFAAKELYLELISNINASPQTFGESNDHKSHGLNIPCNTTSNMIPDSTKKMFEVIPNTDYTDNECQNIKNYSENIYEKDPPENIKILTEQQYHSMECTVETTGDYFDKKHHTKGIGHTINQFLYNENIDYEVVSEHNNTETNLTELNKGIGLPSSITISSGDQGQISTDEMCNMRQILLSPEPIVLSSALVNKRAESVRSSVQMIKDWFENSVANTDSSSKESTYPRFVTSDVVRQHQTPDQTANNGDNYNITISCFVGSNNEDPTLQINTDTVSESSIVLDYKHYSCDNFDLSFNSSQLCTKYTADNDKEDSLISSNEVDKFHSNSKVGFQCKDELDCPIHHELISKEDINSVAFEKIEELETTFLKPNANLRANSNLLFVEPQECDSISIEDEEIDRTIELEIANIDAIETPDIKEDDIFSFEDTSQADVCYFDRLNLASFSFGTIDNEKMDQIIEQEINSIDEVTLPSINYNNSMKYNVNDSVTPRKVIPVDPSVLTFDLNENENNDYILSEASLSKKCMSNDLHFISHESITNYESRKVSIVKPRLLKISVDIHDTLNIADEELDDDTQKELQEIEDMIDLPTNLSEPERSEVEKASSAMGFFSEQPYIINNDSAINKNEETECYSGSPENQTSPVESFNHKIDNIVLEKEPSNNGLITVYKVPDRNDEFEHDMENYEFFKSTNNFRTELLSCSDNSNTFEQYDNTSLDMNLDILQSGAGESYSEQFDFCTEKDKLCTDSDGSDFQMWSSNVEFGDPTDLICPSEMDFDSIISATNLDEALKKLELHIQDKGEHFQWTSARTPYPSLQSLEKYFNEGVSCFDSDNLNIHLNKVASTEEQHIELYNNPNKTIWSHSQNIWTSPEQTVDFPHISESIEVSKCEIESQDQEDDSQSWIISPYHYPRVLLGNTEQMSIIDEEDDLRRSEPTSPRSNKYKDVSLSSNQSTEELKSDNSMIIPDQSFLDQGTNEVFQTLEEFDRLITRPSLDEHQFVEEDSADIAELSNKLSESPICESLKDNCSIKKVENIQHHSKNDVHYNINESMSDMNNAMLTPFTSFDDNSSLGLTSTKVYSHVEEGEKRVIETNSNTDTRQIICKKEIENNSKVENQRNNTCLKDDDKYTSALPIYDTDTKQIIEDGCVVFGNNDMNNKVVLHIDNLLDDNIEQISEETITKCTVTERKAFWDKKLQNLKELESKAMSSSSPKSLSKIRSGTVLQLVSCFSENEEMCHRSFLPAVKKQHNFSKQVNATGNSEKLTNINVDISYSKSLLEENRETNSQSPCERVDETSAMKLVSHWKAYWDDMITEQTTENDKKLNHPVQKIPSIQISDDDECVFQNIEDGSDTTQTLGISQLTEITNSTEINYQQAKIKPILNSFNQSNYSENALQNVKFDNDVLDSRDVKGNTTISKSFSADLKNFTNSEENQIRSNCLLAHIARPRSFSTGDIYSNSCQNETDQEPIEEGNVTVENSPPQNEFKQRFERARQFFKHLEQNNQESVKSKNYRSMPRLEHINNKTRKPSVDSDSGADTKPQRRRNRFRSKKKKKKDRTTIQSAPTSDTESSKRINHNYSFESFGGSVKSIKVSERFHVKDLFRDVSRTGGFFKGIPNRAAVLATLKSVDDVRAASPYHFDYGEIKSSSSLGNIPSGFQEEYPYLPTTPVHQFHPRSVLEYNLIPRSELLDQPF